jgi:hypothetical protein
MRPRGGAQAASQAGRGGGLTARRGAQAAHLDNIKREVAVLARLRGTLNVVHFKRAYEDASHVHIVMEARAPPASPGDVLVVLPMLTAPRFQAPPVSQPCPSSTCSSSSKLAQGTPHAHTPACPGPCPGGRAHRAVARGATAPRPAGLADARVAPHPSVDMSRSSRAAVPRRGAGAPHRPPPLQRAHGARLVLNSHASPVLALAL